MDTLIKHFRRSFERHQQDHPGADRAAYLAGYKAAPGNLAGSAQAAAAAASGLIMAIEDASEPLLAARTRLLDAMPEHWAIPRRGEE